MTFDICQGIWVSIPITYVLAELLNTENIFLLELKDILAGAMRELLCITRIGVLVQLSRWWRREAWDGTVFKWWKEAQPPPLHEQHLSIPPSLFSLLPLSLWQVVVNIFINFLSFPCSPPIYPSIPILPIFLSLFISPQYVLFYPGSFQIICRHQWFHFCPSLVNIG